MKLVIALKDGITFFVFDQTYFAELSHGMSYRGVETSLRAEGVFVEFACNTPRLGISGLIYCWENIILDSPGKELYEHIAHIPPLGCYVVSCSPDPSDMVISKLLVGRRKAVCAFIDLISKSSQSDLTDSVSEYLELFVNRVPTKLSTIKVLLETLDDNEIISDDMVEKLNQPLFGNLVFPKEFRNSYSSRTFKTLINKRMAEAEVAMNVAHSDILFYLKFLKFPKSVYLLQGTLKALRETVKLTGLESFSDSMLLKIKDSFFLLAECESPLISYRNSVAIQAVSSYWLHYYRTEEPLLAYAFDNAVILLEDSSS